MFSSYKNYLIKVWKLFAEAWKLVYNDEIYKSTKSSFNS